MADEIARYERAIISLDPNPDRSIVVVGNALCGLGYRNMRDWTQLIESIPFTRYQWFCSGDGSVLIEYLPAGTDGAKVPFSQSGRVETVIDGVASGRPVYLDGIIRAASMNPRELTQVSTGIMRNIQDESIGLISLKDIGLINTDGFE